MGKTTPFLIVSTVYLLIVLLTQWSTFTISYPLSQYENMYNQSQYVLGEKHSILMGDGDIYTYAGIRYVQGEDPTKINFEHPPLGKYLFGLSYILFGYPNIVLVLLFIIMLVCFWYLSELLFINSVFKYLSLGLFLLHSTVFKELARTMLDLPQTTFFLLVTSAYCSLVKNPTYSKVVLFGLVSGMLMSVKYPFPLIGIYFVLLIISAIFHNVSIRKIALSLVIAIITYLFTYINYFLHGNSIFDFIKFEWWRWQWFKGKTDNPKGLIFQVIFLGKYKKWWDNSNEYVTFTHWNLLWPVSLILYALSWVKKNIDYQHLLFPYKIWIVIVLITYYFGAYEDRFLLPLIPGFALFGAKFIEQYFIRHKNEIISR